MKLKAIRLKNFRGYIDSGWMTFSDLTVLVGRNDSGKSTILDALDVFFNGKDAGTPIGISDVNASTVRAAQGKKVQVEIACRFSDLPVECELDESERTSFSEEGLLNFERDLEIVRVYPNGGNPKTYVETFCCEFGAKYKRIFTQTNAELKNYADIIAANCENKSSNVCLRRAVRGKLTKGSVPIVQRLEFAGDRLSALWKMLPRYEIFRSDRPNGVDDDEVQNPVKLAVRRAFDDADVQDLLGRVERKVRDELKQVMDLARDKMSVFDKNMVKSLSAQYPKTESLKWWDVFKKVTFCDQNGVSIDKRGSGVRRLLLMSFFQAQISQAFEVDVNKTRDVIYAIEEPETAQHSDNQVKIADTLRSLSEKSQVFLSTHSGLLLKHLDGAKIWTVDVRSGTCELHEVRDDVSLEKKRYLNPVSIAEISYLMLGDSIIEYHEELFGYLSANNLWKSCDSYCVKLPARGCRKYYKRTDEQKEKMHGLPLYVRDTLHHPENTKNKKATLKEVRDSIDLMRQYVEEKGLKELAIRAAKQSDL